MSISFDRVSAQYDASRTIPPDALERIVDCMLDCVAATQETHFFEPGIGTGRIALPLVQRGYLYTGIDISENMMAELRQKVAGFSHRLTLLQADVTNLPFEDKTFDVAIAVHLLHLVADWPKALHEIRRVLKPDGIFLYSHGRVRPMVNQEDDRNPGVAAFKQKWQALLAEHQFEIQYSASESEILQLLQQQGATLETLIPVEWRVPLTVGELLSRYQQRLHSSCWQIPDEIFSQAIAQLTTWCECFFDAWNTDLSYTNPFKLVVVRDWARLRD